MPLPKRSKSSVGIMLANDIYSFMEKNSDYLNKPPSNPEDASSSIKEGNRAIAEAIAYGISKALSNDQFHLALKPIKGLDGATIPVVPAPPGAVITSPVGPCAGAIPLLPASIGTTISTAFDTVKKLFKE